MIRFSQDEWLNSYFEMKTELRQRAKNNFEKDFFKLMNNAVFEKIIKNVRKHSDIQLLTTERRRNYLISGPFISNRKFISNSNIRKLK